MTLSERDLENIALNFKNILNRYDLTYEFVNEKVDLFITLIEEDEGVEINSGL